MSTLYSPETSCTKIIYLIGKPGTGKHTIAQELKNFGFCICDNHLINNPIFALLNGKGALDVSDIAWQAIDKIRNAVFSFLEQKTTGSYALTNVLYEKEEDHLVYRQVETMAKARGSLLIPVLCTLSKEENLKRLLDPSREIRMKSRDPQDIDPKVDLIKIDHPHLFHLDVTSLSAARAAEKILVHISQVEQQLNENQKQLETDQFS